MKKKLIGIFVCMLLIATVLSVSGASTQTLIAKSEKIDMKFLLSNYEDTGIKGGYRSLIDIPSPDGNNYSCIMYCNNHEQTLEWISLIDESGFEKAWLKQFIKLTTFFILPGTILLFGLDDFRHWYFELSIKLKHRDEFLDFLNNYDELNGSGMITYKWLAGVINKPIDFKSQPDDTWIENSWILDDNGKYIPNPEIWDELPFLPFLP
jgi:hypothetical protein